MTPKKYQVYESKEVAKYPKRFYVKGSHAGKARGVTQDAEPNLKNVKQSTDYDYEGTPGEIKARTADLRYEEKDLFKDYVPDNSTDSKGGKKSKPGTMIPTREFFKMSSPNYYAKVPNIAQKYDFNEPIPERDREPEDLKPIGNPAASINRKIKLT